MSSNLQFGFGDITALMSSHRQRDPIEEIEYFKVGLNRILYRHIDFLNQAYEPTPQATHFTKKLIELSWVAFILGTFSSTILCIASLNTNFKTLGYLSISITGWILYGVKSVSRFQSSGCARHLLILALSLSLMQIAIAKFSNFPIKNYAIIEGTFQLWYIMVQVCWILPEYLCVFLLSSIFLNDVYKVDQRKLRGKIQRQMNQACSAYEASHSKVTKLSKNFVHIIADELYVTMHVVFNSMKKLSFLSDEAELENFLEKAKESNSFGLVLSSCFTHMAKMIGRLTNLERFIEPNKLLEYKPDHSISTNTFPVSGLLQVTGDLLGFTVAREHIELIVNDAEFIFRDIKVFGEGQEIHQIMHHVVRFAVLSSLPHSSVEIGVKVPALSQSKEDPLYPGSRTYPFVFTITYSTVDFADLFGLDFDTYHPLYMLLHHINAKISHSGNTEKRTIYIHCNLTLPPESSTLLHEPFEQQLISNPKITTINDHHIFFVTAAGSKFSSFFVSCWKLLGSTIKLVSTEPSQLTKCLRNLSEKPIPNKRTCIVINEDFTIFQAVIRDLLLRISGDLSKRVLVKTLSVIFLLLPEEYALATQFLEDQLSQFHAALYPKITLIVKPIGFRRFVSLFLSHADQTLSSTDSYHKPYDILSRQSSYNSNDQAVNLGPQSPRTIYRSLGKDATSPRGETNSPLIEKPAFSPAKESPESSNKPAIPSLVITKEETKPTLTPLSKLLPKSKAARNAAKEAKNRPNTPTKDSKSKFRDSQVSPNQSPNRRPGHSSNSYFPQVHSLPINVLIVEDNPINQRILATFMKKRNIKYAVANDGKEAVEKWKSGGFHIVLMDIQLPIMDGIQATKEIRRIEKSKQIGFFSPPSNTPQSEPLMAPSISQPNTPSPRTPPTPIQSPVIIVALTASSLRTDRIEALAAGCNDFLTKPVSLVWLEKKIMEWGCMQALIDIEGWRKLKYTRHTTHPTTTRLVGPATAPSIHGISTNKLSAPASQFQMRSENLLNKLKKAEESKRSASPSGSS